MSDIRSNRYLQQQLESTGMRSSARVSTKPLLEISIQLSKNPNSFITIALFADCEPQDVVENFILQNGLRSQAFNPILANVLEQMRNFELVKGYQVFTNLRDPEYYQQIMRTQQAMCDEALLLKQHMKLEKQRSQALLSQYNQQSGVKSNNSSLSTREFQSPFQQPHPLNEIERNSQQLKSFYPHLAPSASQPQLTSQPLDEGFPETNILSNRFNERSTNPMPSSQKGIKQAVGQTAAEQIQQIKPSNNRTPIKKASVSPAVKREVKKTKSSVSPAPAQQSHLPRKETSSSRLKEHKAAPKSLQFIKNTPIQPQKSPLKYPNEESYLEKSERLKAYYRLSPHEARDLTERLTRKTPPSKQCNTISAKDAENQKECTFQPQINPNSRTLSKLYHERRAREQQEEVYEQDKSGEDFDQLHNQQEYSDQNEKQKSFLEHKDSDYMPQSISQLQQMTEQDSSEEEQNKIINFNPRLNENYFKFLKTYENDDFQEQEEDGGKRQRNTANFTNTQMQTSPPEVSIMSTNSAAVQTSYSQNPLITYSAAIQTSTAQAQSTAFQTSPIPAQSSAIQTSTIAAYSTAIQTSSSPAPTILSQGIQTSISKQQSLAIQTSNQQNNFHSIGMQTSQREAHSFGMQTANLSTHSFAVQAQSQSHTEQSSSTVKEQPQIDFNLNKNFFKYLQMQEDVKNEEAAEAEAAKLGESDQQYEVDQSQFTQNTSSYQRPQIDFNLNKNYFKFLKMEEEKQQEEYNNHPYEQQVQQSQNIIKESHQRNQNYSNHSNSILNESNQSQGMTSSSKSHINRQKYEDFSNFHTKEKQQPMGQLFNYSQFTPQPVAEGIENDEILSSQNDKQEEGSVYEYDEEVSVLASDDITGNNLVNLRQQSEFVDQRQDRPSPFERKAIVGNHAPDSGISQQRSISPSLRGLNFEFSRIEPEKSLVYNQPSSGIAQLSAEAQIAISDVVNEMSSSNSGNGWGEPTFINDKINFASNNFSPALNNIIQVILNQFPRRELITRDKIYTGAIECSLSSQFIQVNYSYLMLLTISNISFVDF